MRVHSELQKPGGRLQFVSQFDARFEVHYQISRIVIGLYFIKWKYNWEAVLTETTWDEILEFHPARTEQPWDQIRNFPLNVLRLRH